MEALLKPKIDNSKNKIIGAKNGCWPANGVYGFRMGRN